MRSEVDIAIRVQRAAHPDGERANARAAARMGLTYCHSTASIYSMEERATAAPEGRRWFQLYWPNHDELTRSLIERAEAAGYEALIVTLDTQLFGWRDQNLELGFLPRRVARAYDGGDKDFRGIPFRSNSGQNPPSSARP